MSRELEKCLINCKTKMESLLQSSIASENDRPLESGQGWCFSKMMQFSWYCTVLCCFDTKSSDPGWPVWRWCWDEWTISKSCLYILYSSTYSKIGVRARVDCCPTFPLCFKARSPSCHLRLSVRYSVFSMLCTFRTTCVNNNRGELTYFWLCPVIFM